MNKNSSKLWTCDHEILGQEVLLTKIFSTHEPNHKSFLGPQKSIPTFSSSWIFPPLVPLGTVAFWVDARLENPRTWRENRSNWGWNRFLSVASHSFRRALLSAAKETKIRGKRITNVSLAVEEDTLHFPLIGREGRGKIVAVKGPFLMV